MLHALAQPTAALAAEMLARTMDPARYRPFHCIIADTTSAHLVWHAGSEIRNDSLTSGLHVITQWSLGACERDRNVRRFFPEPEAPIDAFRTALTQHDPHNPYDGTCVHRPNEGYGSRSTSLIIFTNDGRIQYAHANDPPCRATWTEEEVLITNHLDRHCERAEGERGNLTPTERHEIASAEASQ